MNMRRRDPSIHSGAAIMFSYGADIALHFTEHITQEVMQLGYRTDCTVEVTETRYIECGVGG